MTDWAWHYLVIRPRC